MFNESIVSFNFGGVILNVFLDLFAGFGGASEAFMDDPNWEVQRVDNNELLNQVENMTIANIYALRDELKHHYDNGWRPSKEITIVWASIPCNEVSLGFSSKRSQSDRGEIDNWYPEETMALLEATLQIIEILQPQYWVIENVRGSLTYFQDVLGKPRQIIAQKYVLYGKYPHIHVRGEIKSKFDKDTWSNDPLRANKRAVIPIVISEALKEAIQCQTKLTDFV